MFVERAPRFLLCRRAATVCARAATVPARVRAAGLRWWLVWVMGAVCGAEVSVARSAVCFIPAAIDVKLKLTMLRRS